MPTSASHLPSPSANAGTVRLKAWTRTRARGRRSANREHDELARLDAARVDVDGERWGCAALTGGPERQHRGGDQSVRSHVSAVRFGAEAALRNALHADEPGLLIDAARRGQLGLRPERQLLVAGAPREADALVDEALAEAEPARARLDEEQSQLRDRLRLADDEAPSRRSRRRVRRSSSARPTDRSGRGSRRRCARRAPRIRRCSPTRARRARRAGGRPSPCRPAGAGAAGRAPGAAAGAPSSRSMSCMAETTFRCAGADSGPSMSPTSRRARLSSGANAVRPARGQPQHAPARIVARGGAAEQPARFEAAQDAAQIARVEPEVAAELGRGRAARCASS